MADDCNNPLNAINCGISSIVQGELEKFAQQLMDGVNDMWNNFATSWIGSGVDGIIGGDTAQWFQGVTLPVQAFLLALGVMVAGIRIALSARGEVAAGAAKRFFRAILVAVAGVTFFQVMLVGSNALSKSILEAAQITDGPAAGLWQTQTFASNVALALIFGLLGVIAVGVQWGIMLFRAVALTVLLPFWPIAAAGAMFEKHEAMFEKVTGWLLAYLVYSPVAAALYGIAIRFQQGRDGLGGIMIGMAVFVLAILALPALMRLVVPLTTAIGRASAGGIILGTAKTVAITTVAVGSAIATGGAAAAPAAAGSAGAAGGAGAAGATGSAGAAGAAGTAGATGSAGASGANGSSGAGSGGSGSGRSGWDSARDLAHAIPDGSKGVGGLIDDE